MSINTKVEAISTPAPRVGPGTQLHLTIPTTSQVLPEGTYTVSIKQPEQRACIKRMKVDELEVELKDLAAGQTFRIHKQQDAVSFVILFTEDTTALSQINGIELQIANTAKNTGGGTTIYQPLIVDIPAPIPTVISRKDSVPTGYTRNIARFEMIRTACERLKFSSYVEAVDLLLCKGVTDISTTRFAERTNRLLNRRSLPFTGDDAYLVLKAATEAYVLLNASMQSEGTYDSGPTDTAARLRANRIGAIPVPEYPIADAAADFDSNGLLPYFQLIYARLPNEALKKNVFPVVESGIILPYHQENIQASLPNGRSESSPDAEERMTLRTDVRQCVGILQDRMQRPLMVELIWSYWHEQAMLAQTMYAIRNRVQNISESPGTDPLAHMEIGPLRPLNTLLWTYIQDEQHRLTVSRRNFEYEHQYGLSLRGKALRTLQPAERRSKFLEAFHNLLYLASVYFKEDDDTNRKADAFPVLHALKEVHFLLSEGAHNQFGDLPTTSRIEMMMEQWLLARPEFQRFLPTRESIAYPEAWMGTVDAMKTVQGWTSTSVIFFSDLAQFGEMLLLSIRYEAWAEEKDRDVAANWAKCFRSEIQGYTHAFRIVTGVDLSLEPAGLAAEDRRRDPSDLILQRWEDQRRTGSARPVASRLPAAPSGGVAVNARLRGKS